MSEDLARRAIACEGWRWLPGMVDTRGARTLFVAAEGDSLISPHGAPIPILRAEEDPDKLPDLTDPATIGCLLALVREAHGRPDLIHRHVLTDPPTPRPWLLSTPGGYASGATEAEVLVEALEMAQGVGT